MFIGLMSLLAQVDSEPAELSLFAKICVYWGPVVFVVGLIMILFQRMGVHHLGRLHARTFQHMDRIEAQSAEMIVLLREIKEQLQKGRP